MLGIMHWQTEVTYTAHVHTWYKKHVTIYFMDPPTYVIASVFMIPPIEPKTTNSNIALT